MNQQRITALVRQGAGDEHPRHHGDSGHRIVVAAAQRGLAVLAVPHLQAPLASRRRPQHPVSHHQRRHRSLGRGADVEAPLPNPLVNADVVSLTVLPNVDKPPKRRCDGTARVFRRRKAFVIVCGVPLPLGLAKNLYVRQSPGHQRPSAVP